jgi:hypothetical protein
MAVITLAEAKVFLQISGTDKDALITALIPEVEAFMREYCNVNFTDPWHAGMKLIASQMIGYNMAEMSGGGNSIGLESESQGDYSYSRGTGNGSESYPVSITKKLDKYKVSRTHFGQYLTNTNDKRGLTLGQLADDKFVNSVEGVPYADQ